MLIVAAVVPYNDTDSLIERGILGSAGDEGEEFPIYDLVALETSIRRSVRVDMILLGLLFVGIAMLCTFILSFFM